MLISFWWNSTHIFVVIQLAINFSFISWFSLICLLICFSRVLFKTFEWTFVLRFFVNFYLKYNLIQFFCIKLWIYRLFSIYEILIYFVFVFVWIDFSIHLLQKLYIGFEESLRYIFYMSSHFVFVSILGI